MSRKKFLCLDCGIDTGKSGEHYMLIDETWKLTGLGKFGMLCVEHVEARIGRKLVPDDFNDSYLNNFRTGIKSARLSDRMRGVDSAAVPT
jgi:hypothetical protein